MTIDKNKVVAVSYELEVEGSIADKAGSEKPLEYIHGSKPHLRERSRELLSNSL